MPGCWPIVVWRSSGGRGWPWADDTSGYHPARGRPGPPIRTRFPRFALLDGPSPLRPLPRFSAALGGRAEVWIKREDLLPLAFGGNKLRNLEFLVGAALAEGADTPGDVRPALVEPCRLTAAAGAKAGLAVHLVLSGPPVDPPNPGVRLDELLGATVHQAATDDRAERAAIVERGRRRAPDGRAPPVRHRDRRHRASSGRSARCSPGSSSRTSWPPRRPRPDDRRRAVGDRWHPGRAARRASDRRAGDRPSTGSRSPPGGRAALDDHRGLVAGARPVTGARRRRPTARSSSTATSSATAMAGRPPRPTRRPALLARTEGILVDPIYTAKALAGLVALVRDGRARRPPGRLLARRRRRPACSSRSTPDPDVTKPPTDAGGFEGCRVRSLGGDRALHVGMDFADEAVRAGGERRDLRR